MGLADELSGCSAAAATASARGSAALQLPVVVKGEPVQYNVLFLLYGGRGEKGRNNEFRFEPLMFEAHLRHFGCDAGRKLKIVFWSPREHDLKTC